MERLTEKQLHILRQKLCDMKNRCYNPQNKFYKDYDGRGITVCSEWLDKKNGHKNFREWALENGWKEGYSINRINVNGNYEPSNCRWSTPTEQANNRRNNNFVTINGVTKTISEWAKQIGISQNAFAERVRRGWSEDKLLDPKYKPLKMTKSEMSKEIRMYRKLEEQGLLLRVPCGIGADVYFIPSETNFKLNILNDKPQFNRVYHQNVARITFIRNGWYMECDKDLQYATGNILVDKMYKETWFLSQAEAEKKLKEMERD